MMIGVIQTGDINEAIRVAQERVARGERICVFRHVYPIDEDERVAFEEYKLSDGLYGHVLSHDAIEYEVHAEDTEYNKWLKEKELKEKRFSAFGATEAEHNRTCDLLKDENGNYRLW